MSDSHEADDPRDSPDSPAPNEAERADRSDRNDETLRTSPLLELETEPEQRSYIGDIAISRAAQEASDANPLRKELRQELVRQFVIKKFRRNLDRHVEHISGSREIAQTVQFLFDEHGDPPRNAPIEDIVSRRKDLESQIRWLDVLAAELRTRLTSLREIEEAALATIGQD